MFFELIGTLIAGAAAGLLFWAINRTLKGRLPKGLLPVVAGAAMIIATISSEYGWFDRTSGAMPEGMVVAQTVTEKTFYRPWTYAKPFVTRFIAVDQATTRTHPDQPDLRMVDLLFYGRWTGTVKAPVLFDCSSAKRADLIDGVEFDASGQVINPSWMMLEDGDPLLQAACA